MNFDFNDDQQAIADGVGQVVNGYVGISGIEADYYLNNSGFQASLETSEFLEVGRLEDFGAFEALLVVESVAHSPFVVELVGSAFILPRLGLLPTDGPLAVLQGANPRPARFLASGGTVLVDLGNEVRRVQGSDVRAESTASPYAYPIGRWTGGDLATLGETLEVEPARFRHLWRLALVAEGVGCMDAALKLVVDYVKTRRQFGHPLGAFQVIQHRLSECAVLVQASRALMQEAATLDDPEASAFAATYMQEVCAKLIYETHQFHGAIGLTLEYPLHYWTYRLRVLQGELGGMNEQALAAADLVWPEGKPISDAFMGQDC